MTVENLLQLFAHEEVGFELVFFFEEDIPEFVEVGVGFEAEFFGAPGTAGFELFALVYRVACKFFEVLGGAKRARD